MLRFIIASFVLLVVATPSQAVIQFKDGWNIAGNSNVKKYSEEEATAYLRNASDNLKKIIDGPQACVLQVTKGCHQPGDPHFTGNGALSTSKCKVDSVYVGSRSIHTVCP